MPTAEPVVCMVAYTQYATDARVRREAETLAAGGFRVICLTNRNGAVPERYALAGVDVRELNVPKYRGKSQAAYLRSYLRFLARASAACLDLRLRRRLDAVHVHNLPDFLVFAGLLPRFGGAKVVLDVHDSVPETFATKFSAAGWRYRLLCLEERVSALAAHRVICVNHPQRDTLVARGIPGGKTFVSMNVPDERIFRRDGNGPAAAPVPGTFNLVYHGTMADRLGVDLVIRAVHRLRERIPCLHLHLWGHGDDLPAYQGLVRELQLEDRVHFKPGGVPLEQLPPLLRAMHVGVVGNRRSIATDLMLPVKLMEYVALGVPAVVPRLRTIQHYFTDDMVSYYQPEDVESMAESISRLYRRPELRDAQRRSAEAFLREFGWDRQGPELVSFYRRLVEN